VELTRSNKAFFIILCTIL